MTVLDAEGNERSAWVASRVTGSGYRYDYYVAPKKLAKVAKNRGSYAAISSRYNWSGDYGNVWKAYSSNWNVENRMMGLAFGTTGISNLERVNARLSSRSNLTGLEIKPINFTTSSGSLASYRTYTIYNRFGELHKFGVSDAGLIR